MIAASLRDRLTQTELLQAVSSNGYKWTEEAIVEGGPVSNF